MDGSVALVVKRVKYSVSKELKVPGVLTVTETQLCWVPHIPTQSQPVYVDIKSIPGDLPLPEVCVLHPDTSHL